MANKSPKTDALIDHNKRLQAKNIRRVKAALEKMLAQSEEVNIARLSEKTGVSRSTIYRNKELRDLIDKFRETSLLRRNREVKFQKELRAEKAAQSKLKTVTDALKAERLETTRLREENKRLKEHIEHLMEKYSKVYPI